MAKDLLNQDGLDPNSDYTSFARKRLEKKRRLSPKYSNLQSTEKLGLDHLSDYEDYLDLSKTNVYTQDVNKLRAQGQGGLEQAFNAVVGGIGMGLATAVEDLSYIADFDNHVKAMQGLDTNEKNWLAETMGGLKENIREGMPIYRENPSEVFDWSDPAFYWDSMRGIIDSAVGFGLPGGVVSKGVSAVGKGVLAMSKAVKNTKKASNFIEGSKNAKRFDTYMSSLIKNQPVMQGANSLGAGYVQNYAEGKIMALETYDETEKELLELRELGELNLSDDEIKKVAGDAADRMLLYNKAFILTDAFGLHGLMKGVGTTRNIIKQRGFKNRFKNFKDNITGLNSDNLIVQGAKESVEEIGQSSLQKESSYRAKKDAGVDVSGYDEDVLARLADFASRDEALLEGMMGFFGGGPQRILSEAMSGRYTKSGREAYDKSFSDQQVAIAESASFVEGTSENFIKKKELAAKYEAKGETELARAVEYSTFAAEAIKHFANGTTGVFEEDLQRIASGEVTEEEKAAWGDNHQKKAQLFLDELSNLEKEWIRNSNRGNVSQVVSNYAMKETNSKIIKSFENKRAQALENLQEVINDITKAYKPTIKDESGKVTPFTFDIENLKSNPYKGKGLKSASAQYNMMLNRIKDNSDYKEYLDLDNKLNNNFYDPASGKVRPGLYKRKEKLNNEYNKSKTPEAEKEFIKKQQELSKNAAKAMDDAAKEATVQEDLVSKGNKYTDKNGSEWIVDDITEDGKYKIKKAVNPKSTTLLTQEQFDNKFKNESGQYSTKVSKEKAEKYKTEKATTKQQRKDKEPSTSAKTSEEKKVNKTPGDPKEIFNYGVTNKEKDTGDDATAKLVDENRFKSRNPLSLAWLSSSNREESEKGNTGNIDITDYLEQKNIDVVGKKVTIEVGLPDVKDTESDYYKEQLDLYNSFQNRNELSEEDKKELLEKLIHNGTISVTLLDENGKPIEKEGTPIKLFLHTPTFIKGDSDYKNSMTSNRKDILERLMKGEVVTSEVVDKSNGSIQNGNTLNPIQNILFDTDNKDISLSVRHSNGNFAVGMDEDGNLTYDDDLGLYESSSSPKGAIFAKVKTANGESFPLRLFVDNINKYEAELIYMIYNKIIGGTNPSLQLSNEKLSDIVDYLNTVKETATNREDKAAVNRVTEILGLLPNKKDSSLVDLLNFLVYEGKHEDGNTKNPTKYPLYSENFKVHFGKMSMGKKHTPVVKEQFINWLLENKIRNVDFKRINDIKYKNHLLNNNMLKSNAIIGDEGPVFAQPTITIKQTNSSSTSGKFNKNTGQMNPGKEFFESEGTTVEEFGGATDKTDLDVIKNELTSNPKGLRLVETEDSRYYLDKDGNRYLGMSNIVNKSDFKDDEGRYSGASPIGKTIDRILRDFFSGKKITYTDNIKERLSKKAFDELITTITNFKNTFKDENGSLDHIEFLTEGLFISNYNIKAEQKDIDNAVSSEKDRKKSYGLATELDMVIINRKTGAVDLVDFKTVRLDPNNKYSNTVSKKINKSWNGKLSDKEGYSKQQNASREILKLNTGIKFDSMSLLPIQVWYPDFGQKTLMAKIVNLEKLETLPISSIFPSSYSKQIKKLPDSKSKKQPAQQSSEVEKVLVDKSTLKDGDVVYDKVGTKFIYRGVRQEGKTGAGSPRLERTDGSGEIAIPGINIKLYTQPTQQTSEVENVKIPQLKIGKEDLDNYIAELKADIMYPVSNEDIDIHSQLLHDSYAQLIEMYSPQEALELAKNTFLETLKNCL